MAKAPPDLPGVGDRVELRGRGCEGELMLVSDVQFPDRVSQWGIVKWTKGAGPRMVHLHELKRLPIDSSEKSAVCSDPSPVPAQGLTEILKPTPGDLQ